MLDTTLGDAVAGFVKNVKRTPDVALDRAWAWGAYDSEGVRFAFFRTYEELRELAVRMAALRDAHELPITSAQRILAQYHAAFRDLEAALLRAGSDQLDQAPAEAEWPVRQIVTHIVAAEVGFYVVVTHALDRHREPDSHPPEIPTEMWEAIIGMDEDALGAILNGPFDGVRSYHQAIHNRVLEKFSGITDDDLAAPSMYWEGYELSLRFRLHRFDSHLRQHTVQVDKTLQIVSGPPSEAERLLRLIIAAHAEVEGAAIGATPVGSHLRQEVAQKIAARAGEIAGLLE